jgi:anti-anti-sigma factor
MQISTQVHDGIARMALDGRFDFSAHREFRNGYDGLLSNAAVRELEIDLGAVNYLDSSALGMLLLLNERAKAANKSVTLSNCRGMVAQVLEVANFLKIFTIK